MDTSPRPSQAGATVPSRWRLYWRLTKRPFFSVMQIEPFAACPAREYFSTEQRQTSTVHANNHTLTRGRLKKEGRICYIRNYSPLPITVWQGKREASSSALGVFARPKEYISFQNGPHHSVLINWDASPRLLYWQLYRQTGSAVYSRQRKKGDSI